jgi:hypothetical protein
MVAADGADGADGASAVHAAIFSAPTSGSATTNCPIGQVAVGGGGQVTSSGGSLTASYPTATNGWTAESQSGKNVIAYVICASTN